MHISIFSSGQPDRETTDINSIPGDIHRLLDHHQLPEGTKWHVQNTVVTPLLGAWEVWGPASWHPLPSWSQDKALHNTWPLWACGCQCERKQLKPALSRNKFASSWHQISCLFATLLCCDVISNNLTPLTMPQPKTCMWQRGWTWGKDRDMASHKALATCFQKRPVASRPDSSSSGDFSVWDTWVARSWVGSCFKITTQLRDTQLVPAPVLREPRPPWQAKRRLPVFYCALWLQKT